MLKPFEEPNWDAGAASVFYSRKPPFRFPSRRKHDPEAAPVRAHGLAGIFKGLGQVTITPLMAAIANAEGFNVAGSTPQQANNPGDLELGDIGNSTIGPITIFASVDDGWTALANQINLIVSGQSSHYSPTETLAQVGATYSGSNNGNWANNVAASLGVPVSTPFADLAGGTPAVASTPTAASGAGTILSSIPTPLLWAGVGTGILALVSFI